MPNHERRGHPTHTGLASEPRLPSIASGETTLRRPGGERRRDLARVTCRWRVARGRSTSAAGSGGGRGLGTAISTEAAPDGTDAALDGRDRCSLERHAGNLPGSPFVLDIDLTATRSADSIVSAVLERFGRLDGVVNNAGSAHFGPATSITEAEWDARSSLSTSALRSCSPAEQQWR
ncbi:SDR family NAD(P)-dependent oxidoreductase [Streptomyces purpurascens]|uniref:SDR family NAD(P)-dependent oxidoreductase n=1 Tax=Streptomyces purpurascens TaxID=1924 RepID=UPI0033F26BF5